MRQSNAKEVIDFYRAREAGKSGVDLERDGNVRENIRVINSCAYWDLNEVLSTDEFRRLVTVICNESAGLIKNGNRLLGSVAQEADRQLREGWVSGRDEKWIRKIISDLEQGMIFDPIILREKVGGEPKEGSYYLQDGNHRVIAAGIFLLRNGVMPELNFHVGRKVDEIKFFSKDK